MTVKQNIKPHQTRIKHNVEWYTPEKYIISARNVMGSIDLDPASSLEANKIVKTEKILYFL